MKTIQRYKNRKLYCREEKRFVSTVDLLSWRDSQEPFKIICSQTKNDITSKYVERALSYRLYKEVYRRGLI